MELIPYSWPKTIWALQSYLSELPASFQFCTTLNLSLTITTYAPNAYGYEGRKHSGHHRQSKWSKVANLAEV